MKDAAAHRLYGEAGTWLNRGRGSVIAALLDRYCTRPGDVLDIGSGVGVHLSVLARHGPLDVIETNDEALAALTRRPEIRTLYRQGLPDLELDRRYEVIGAFDVIEHIRDEQLALEWIAEHLVENGLFLVTVPAYQWLFSAHDVANEHYRRYSRGILRDVMPPELRVVRCGYFNSILFPLAVTARAAWSITRRLRIGGNGAITDKQPSRVPGPMDQFFRGVLNTEAAIIKAGVTPPFGLSVFAVARRRPPRVSVVKDLWLSALLRGNGRSTSDAPQLDLSAVVPLYNEQESVGELIEQLIGGLEATGRRYEIILVDDGSTDGTAAAIWRAQTTHEEVRGVFLARNYGQSTAMQAGFDHSRGAIVVTLDGDLQNDPADIARMLRLMEKTGADLVSGWRRDRQDGRLRVWVSQVANRVISRMTGLRLHDFGCSMKLYRASLLKQVRIYGEMHRFLPAVLAEVGAKTVELQIRHRPRRFGRSKYGFDRTIRVLLDLILVRFLHRYMHRPLHLFGGFGMGLLGLGVLICGYLSFLKIVLGQEIGGRPLLLLGVFLMISGITLLGQGLLGELVIRVLHEPRGRRQYVEKYPPAGGTPARTTPLPAREPDYEVVTVPGAVQRQRS